MVASLYYMSKPCPYTAGYHRYRPVLLRISSQEIIFVRALQFANLLVDQQMHVWQSPAYTTVFLCLPEIFTCKWDRALPFELLTSISSISSIHQFQCPNRMHHYLMKHTRSIHGLYMTTTLEQKAARDEMSQLRTRRHSLPPRLMENWDRCRML